MNNKIKYFCLLALSIAGLKSQAQSTLQSPYSKFGIGNLSGVSSPQLKAMGGISTGIFRSSYIDNVNAQNPASYAGIRLTTLDIGMAGNISSVKTNSLTEKSFTSSISHLLFAFPVSRQSALSIGLKPYSELGYGFRNQVTIGTNANNTKNVNHIYNGEGGISNAYLGYGIQFGDHFRAGVNAEYLFGNLIESNATEFINEPGSMNSKNQVKNSIYGFNLGYGLQYDIRLDKKTGITLGYSGSAKHRLNSEMSKYATIYQLDMNGNELSAIDTLDAVENNKTNLTLPTTHNFGISIHKENKWLVGADVRTGQWSSYNVANVNQNLQNTFGISVGGQITPDASAISGYFKRVDYRLGFLYDKTYIQMNGQDIKQTAITFGLGLPLASYARSSFYKMNISAEIGKRGKLTNGLIQENYFNINLGFMLNDRWFQRFKFD